MISGSRTLVPYSRRITRARVPLTSLSRYASSSSSRAVQPLKVAVIGAGPSGFYSASRILSLLPPTSEHGKNIRIDMYERLPTPYGLARYGVAPDHPEVKNCQHKFDELASDSRFTFLGNVSVGSAPVSTHSSTLPSYSYPHALHLPLASLLPYYDAVIFAYGASLSNPLASVPGSPASSTPLSGVLPALAFVSWYNGHPAFADLSPDLSRVETVDVVGQGNVALDVARILLHPIDSLAKTDMPKSVLSTLAQSSVRRVRAVGRRGPGQVAFSTKEFREMVNLPGVEYPGIDAGLMNEAKALAKGDRMRTRLLALMDKPVTMAGGAKRFELDFLKSPRAFLPGSGSDSGAVRSVEWDVTELVPPLVGEGGGQTQLSARKTGLTVKSPADMVVESVGYRSEPLDELSLPFDIGRGRVRNVAGRVHDDAGFPVHGLYAAGWAARGPVGVIASTMQDAYALASTVIDDLLSPSAASKPEAPSSAAKADPVTTSPSSSPSGSAVVEVGRPDEVERGLREGRVIDLTAWTRIDAAECERARADGMGKEREKFTRVEDMLAVLS